MARINTMELVRLLVIAVGYCQAESADSGKDRTPCTLGMEMARSVGKCLTQNSTGRILNLDSPKEVMGLLTDANRRSCMAKCVMQDRGLLDANGKINLAGASNFRVSIPEEMQGKLTVGDVEPCLTIATKFEPETCNGYGEFSQCILGVLVKAFDPAALDCLNEIPAVGPLFGLLQSFMKGQKSESESGGPAGNIGKFITRIRERVSSGGGVRNRMSDWVKDI